MKKFTDPKLHIPKDANGKPTVAKGKYWYVYYNYRNPWTKKFDRGRPFIIKKDINRLKTVRERKAYGLEIIRKLTILLNDGFTPWDESNIEEFESKRMNVVDALDKALANKKSELKESTYYDYESRKKKFVEWLTDRQLNMTFIDEIKKKHITVYLNHLSETMSNRNVNNHKTVLSALFSKVMNDNDDVLKSNIFLSIKNRVTKPSAHKSYSKTELEKLKAHLTKYDPYLYDFMRFVAYSFMRNVEVTRIKVKHIDMENWNLTIESKTDAKELVPIIETLQPIITKMDLKKYDQEDYLFTPQMHPGAWETGRERYKVGWFGKRFKKAKDVLGLDFDNTIYSLRHTAAIDLYNYFMAQGLNEREIILKMLPITRHANESGLRNYLRGVSAYKVEDYSDKFTMDF